MVQFSRAATEYRVLDGDTPQHVNSGLDVFMRPLTWLAMSLLALTSLAVAGCTATAAFRPGTIPTGISQQQQRALADGKVTQDEYLAGFDAFASCLGAKGYPVTRTGEYGRVLEFSVPAAAVSNGTEQECYAYNFELLDVRWQVANEDRSRQADRLRRCLIQVHGITPKPTLVEIVKQFEEINVKPESCPTR